MDEDRKSNDLPAKPRRFGLFSRYIVLPAASASSLPTLSPAVVLISGETIARVIECGPEGLRDRDRKDLEGWDIEDIGDLVVCPGLVDVNCCFNSDVVDAGDDSAYPESASFSASSSCPTGSAEEYWEDYTTGTRAAVAGGITTVVESPTLRYSNLLSAEAVTRKLKRLQEQQLYCDVGVLAYAGSNNIEAIQDMVAAGALGFLGYMVPPCAHLGYFETEDDLKRGMSLIHESNSVLVLHPERTSSRFLFMASPYRQHAREDAEVPESPNVTCFAAAFPEDRHCGSSDTSPFNQETPIKHSPQQAEDLEKCIQRHQDNLENLVEVEMRSYCESGGTFYCSSPVKRRSPVSDRASLPFSGILTLSNNQPPRQSYRPPPISCRLEKKISESSDYGVLLANSPPHWEANGLSTILKCMSGSMCRVHIASVSSASAVCQAKKARGEEPELKLTWEISIPHLYFSSTDVKTGDTRFKTNPPIRDPTNRSHLVELLKRSAIDCVSSAHRPIKPGLKYLQSGNFQRALSGISDMGLTLSALLSVLASEDMTLAVPLIAKVASSQPANVLGLTQKGEIAVGKHADLVLFDAWKRVEVKAENLNVKHPELSPFLGESMKGRVVRTYLRGEVVFDGNWGVARGRPISR